MQLSQVIANQAPQPMLLPLAEDFGTLVPPSVGGTLLKSVATFATIGAALGFGASFLSVPVFGGMSAPIAAAVGGGIGAVLGLVKGLLSVRSQNSGYEAAVAAELVQYKAQMHAREKAHPTMILVVGKHPKPPAAKRHRARASKPLGQAHPRLARSHHKAASASK